MALILEVISYLSVPQAFSERVNQEDMTIGRMKDNTLRLADPDKFVSSRHAKITYRAPHYVITDTSTNGVFVNQDPMPLGKGNSVELADGDQLAIGDYLIAVSITEDSDCASDTPDQDPFSDAAHAEVLSDPVDEIDPDPIDRMIGDNNIIPEDATHSYHDALMPGCADEIDIGGGITKPRNSPQREASPGLDHGNILNEAIPTALPIQKAKEIDDVKSCYSISTHEAESDGLILPSNPNDDPSDNHVIESAESKSLAVEAPPSSQEKTRTDNQSVYGAKIDQASAPESVLIQHFLAGAELNFDNSFTPETFRLIGSLLRESVKGLRDSLLGRSEIKNVLRMEMTLIRPSENNPIKFSVSTEETLRKLLIPSRNGYLSSERAVAQGFQDINAHQLAMLYAVQMTLKSFVKRFDPEHLNTQLQRQNPVIAKIPILRQLKLWRLSRQLYEDLEFEAAERFMELFGSSFAEAYDDEINRIKQATEAPDFELPK